MKEEIEGRESGTNKLVHRVRTWVNNHILLYGILLSTVGMVSILGGERYLTENENERRKAKENNIKENSSFYTEVTTRVQRYWGADMDEDGDIDTIFTDHNDYSYHRKANTITGGTVFEKGDRCFDELYEEIS